MQSRFPIKTTPGGVAMLNVACGTITHPLWNNIDFSPYASLAKRPNFAAFLRKIGLISEVRWKRLQQVDPDIVQWDLRKGLPYPSASFDVVYHSHFLEHLTRADAVEFLKECRRVLKVNGILRIAVPDLQYLVADYCATAHDAVRHEKAIEALLDQMVRKEAVGPSQQKGMMRVIERIVRGSPDKTGERHLWMYDHVSLTHTLMALGFVDCMVHSAVTSQVAGWSDFQLDADKSGTPYKPESLYLEATYRGTPDSTPGRPRVSEHFADLVGQGAHDTLTAGSRKQ